MKSTFMLAALSILTSVVSGRRCLNVTVPVTISSRNGVFNLTAPQNNIEVTNFILNFAQQGSNYTQKLLQRYATVAGTYNIAATYCEPEKGANTVQILTHGVGFDRSYWDLSANNYNYSYVSWATEQYGYATFAWDRLGIGMSTHGEPVNEIQSFLEIEALAALTRMLRTGTIPGVPKAFHKVAHVGHSFGSALTYGLTARYPYISDGIVLTGFSQNGSFIAYFAFGGNFIDATNVTALASKYTKGYIAAGDVSAVQTNFFSPGQFDPAILQVAYTTGQPVAVGELLTTVGAVATLNTFCGPVLIITGNRDLPFCGGDCSATGNPAIPSIPSTAFQNIPNARNPTTFITPNAGHGLNLEYSHPTTYGTILNYLVSNVSP